MAIKNLHSYFYRGFGILSALVLGGCSGSNEEVQIANCKQLTALFSQGTQAADWVHDGNDIRPSELAIVKLHLDGQTSTSQCYFNNEQAEENVMGDVNPLHNFENTPYKMIVDGKNINIDQIGEGMKQVTIQQGKEIADTVKKNVNEAIDSVKKDLNK